MKKNIFFLLNHIFNNFNNHKPLFPQFNFRPLLHPSFSTGIFDCFSNPNQLILAKKRVKKHYQIKLIIRFIKYGTHLARLLLPQTKKTDRLAAAFPQISAKSNDSNLSKHISLTALAFIYLFLKKQAKIINQSRSNNVMITANYAN